MTLRLSLLGSSEHSSDLALWLEFLAQKNLDQSVRVVTRDLDNLLDGPLDGVLLVDADELKNRDSGLLARRVKRDGVRLWLFGEDPSREVVAHLFRQTEARWLSWPPDLESLSAVLASPQPTRSEPSLEDLESRAQEIALEQALEGEPPYELRPNRSQAEGFGLEPGELQKIEAILKGDDFPLDDDPEFDALLGEDEILEELGDDALELEAAELEEFDEEALDEEEEEPQSAPEPEAPGSSNWFKDQIADLADHVQRLELGLARATEESVSVHASFGEGSAINKERLREISDEAARLGQFTRTLGFLAAPPGRGSQLFDLRTLLEEQLRSRAAEEGAPRFLIRIPDVLPIRSDKTLLLQAFDALLFLARHCTPEGETLRVEATSQQNNDFPLIVVSIRFPRGPLEGMATSEIQRPYALRRVLPELGPNALAAAAGILGGQGGVVELLEDSAASLEWRVSLPRVNPAG